MTKIDVAILGSGNIGADLLVKVLRSPQLECTAFIGRSASSAGIAHARGLGVSVSTEGIRHLQRDPDCCDLVFDATSAASHTVHAPVFQRLGKVAVDLTPAKLGSFCVPAVNVAKFTHPTNINMITCGGQAAIPIACAIGRTHTSVDYIEVVSSIASRSAGPATRLNLDEYIATTELAIRRFSGATNAKAILNLNPAEPCINMQTTISARVADPDLAALESELAALVEKVRSYVPGYEILVAPVIESGRIVVMVRVQGLGDYLPPYAGNLDIINCAAIAVAEQYARDRKSRIATLQGVTKER